MGKERGSFHCSGVSAIRAQLRDGGQVEVRRPGRAKASSQKGGHKLGFAVLTEGEDQKTPAHSCWSVVTWFDLSNIEKNWWEDMEAGLTAQFGFIKVSFRKKRHALVGTSGVVPYQITVRGEHTAEAFDNFLHAFIDDHAVDPGDVESCPLPLEDLCANDTDYDIRVS